MVFFFIGGVAPRAVSRALRGARCPSCGGANSLVERRVDHMLSVFFIPIFPVSRGAPILACSSCGWSDTRMGEDRGGVPPPTPPGHPVGGVPAQPRRLMPPAPRQHHLEQCPSCSRTVEDPAFRFCPFCGTRFG